MKKTEYNQLKASIIKQYGPPLYDMNKPYNESATKLVELKQRFLSEQKEAEKTKQLITDIKDLDIPLNKESINVPEELLKETWLTPFSNDGKKIIKQWLLDITQRTKEISEATGIEKDVVRATMSSEAFKLLRGHLALAYKQILPLEASAALRTLLQSKTDNVVLQAAKLILIDAGIYKGESLDMNITKPTTVVLDEATEEKLRKLGNDIMSNENKE